MTNLPMRSVPAVLLLLLLLLLPAGCGTWARTGGGYEQQDYAVDLPEGWFRLKNVGYLLLTRDGPLLQTVTIASRSADAPFVNTKRRLAERMLPLEAAETVLDDLAFDETIGHLEVLESGPAVVAGMPAFRLSLAYRDHRGLAYRSVRYGVLRGRWFYHLQYDAPQRHYFERDLAAFESMVAGFDFR